MNISSTWAWGVSGKHPVVKDYITLGTQSPSMSGFSRWVEEGYAKVGKVMAQHSWRFYAGTQKKGEIACGLVRDSFDGAGRPFPLLMIGQGRLDGWEDRWEKLPLDFDDLWTRMEFICSKRVFDLDELKGDIGRFPSPVLSGNTGAAAGFAGASPREESQDGMVRYSLDGTCQRDELVRILSMLKGHIRTVPEAVFMGGLLDDPALVVFTRPLVTPDFERLWTTRQTAPVIP